jgi:hypothetical protein
MEQLLKLNSWFTKLTLICVIVVLLGCKVSVSKQPLNLGSNILMTGYLIYDDSNGRAFFIEEKELTNNLKFNKKRNIKKLINNSTKIILIKGGLERFKESQFLSLTLCNKDERLIVKRSELIFNRYYIVKLENYNFIISDRIYEDNKKRYLFCNEYQLSED